MARKYYWLKLNESFYDDITIKMIESMEDGVLYTNFLLKLYLKSLGTEGAMLFRGAVPYDGKMLSVLTGVEESVVVNALKILIDFGVVERWADGTLYLPEIQRMLGSETDSAKRVRKFREDKHEATEKAKGSVAPIIQRVSQQEEIVELEDKRFDTFWAVYKKPVGKGRCKKKWAGLKEKEKVEILRVIDSYVASTPDKAFRKNPLTYLNNNSWEDEVIVRIQNGSRRIVNEFEEKNVSSKDLEM